MSELKETVSPAGLRVRAKIMRENGDESCARHLELAADEIERLREELSSQSPISDRPWVRFKDMDELKRWYKAQLDDPDYKENIMPDPSSSARDALRAVCNAGGELGCSCADQNYQWFDHACRENMATAIKAVLKAQNEQPKFHYDHGEQHDGN